MDRPTDRQTFWFIGKLNFQKEVREENSDPEKRAADTICRVNMTYSNNLSYWREEGSNYENFPLPKLEYVFV